MFMFCAFELEDEQELAEEITLKQTVKPATHLAILYTDRSEFDHKWISQPLDTGDFFTPVAVIFHAPSVLPANLKSHVIKSHNLYIG